MFMCQSLAPPGLRAPWSCPGPGQPGPSPACPALPCPVQPLPAQPCLPSRSSWPSPGPALCLGRCPWLGVPWRGGTSPAIPWAATLPSHRGLGRSAACCSVRVRQTHGTASVPFSSPCETVLAHTTAPSTCSHSLSVDRERHTVKTTLLLH